jgi:hypothetical protein
LLPLCAATILGFIVSHKYDAKQALEMVFLVIISHAILGLLLGFMVGMAAWSACQIRIKKSWEPLVLRKWACWTAAAIYLAVGVPAFVLFVIYSDDLGLTFSTICFVVLAGWLLIVPMCADRFLLREIRD